jgi:hypothetical protein
MFLDIILKKNIQNKKNAVTIDPIKVVVVVLVELGAVVTVMRN